MSNIIPFPGARDDGDGHQIALIGLLDDLQFYAQIMDAIALQASILADLADAIEPRVGPVYSRALREASASVRNATRTGREQIDASRKRAWQALESGERFEQHHEDMVAEVRRLRRGTDGKRS